MKRICIFGGILIFSLGTFVFSNSTTPIYYSYENTEYFYQQINSHTEEIDYSFKQTHC